MLASCADVDANDGGEGAADDDEDADAGARRRARVLSVTGAGIDKKRGRRANPLNRATGTGVYGVHADTRAMRSLKKAIKRSGGRK